MKQVSVLINNNIILRRIWYADTFLTRLRGLMFRKSIDENQGMLITPCKQIHTYFMKFPIDVVFINNDGIVQEIIENMQAGKIANFIKSSTSVLELKAGAVKKYGINKGGLAEIRREAI